jgi:hypothetical protein
MGAGDAAFAICAVPVDAHKVCPDRSIAGFMKVVAARYWGFRRTSAASRLLALVTVLAFALQSFIIQTHIHSGSLAGPSTITTASSPSHSKDSHNKSPADCPLCQAVAHTGAFLTPAAAAMLLPSSVQNIALYLVVRTIAVAHTHGWQSRAPPQH